MSETRVCRMCKVEKPLNYIYFAKTEIRNVFEFLCRDCRVLEKIPIYKRNPDKRNCTQIKSIINRMTTEVDIMEQHNLEEIRVGIFPIEKNDLLKALPLLEEEYIKKCQ